MVSVSDYYDRISFVDRDKLLDMTRMSIVIRLVIDDVSAEKIAQYTGITLQSATVLRELHQAIEDDDPTINKKK